jgi:hypothetical protein
MAEHQVQCIIRQGSAVRKARGDFDSTGIVACQFTVEFKRNGESDYSTIKQIAAASSIPSNNHFRFYCHNICLFLERIKINTQTSNHPLAAALPL